MSLWIIGIFCLLLGNGFLSAADYFPMNIGNSWLYDYSENFVVLSQATHEIIGTGSQSGETYYEFEITLDGDTTNRYLRIENNKVYEYDTAASSEYLTYDLATFQGGTWTVVPGEIDGRMLKKNDFITVGAGTFLNCYKILLDDYYRGIQKTIWLAPDVGTVKQQTVIGIITYDISLEEHQLNPVDEEESVVRNLPVLTGYPHPFSQLTAFSFQLPANDGNPEIKIYDMEGKLVRTLISSKSSRLVGQYEGRWDGRDITGNLLPAGYYFFNFYLDGKFVNSGKVGKIR